MTTNEQKMTLEEKLVQGIKDETLFKLIGDEDAITELVKRALREALYQPTRVKRDYGGWDDKDSPVVSAMREVATRVSKNLIETVTKELLDDPAIRKLIQAAIVENLPAILTSSMQSAFSFQQGEAARSAMLMLQEAVRNKQI